MNSVSTLLNKGGIACRRPRLLRTSVLQQNKHKLSQPLCSSLVPHDTSGSEGRRSTAVRQSFRATRTSSWMLECIVKCFKAHPMPTQTPKHAKTCHRNVHACPCTKTAKVCKKLRSRKSFLKGSTQLDCCSREPQGKQKKSYFSHGETQPPIGLQTLSFLFPIGENNKSKALKSGTLQSSHLPGRAHTVYPAMGLKSTHTNATRRERENTKVFLTSARHEDNYRIENHARADEGRGAEPCLR